MKPRVIISVITALSITLFVAFGCTKQNSVISPFCGGSACKVPPSSGGTFNCLHSSFLSGVEEVLSDPNSSLYIIKGVALDAYNNYGRRIKLIEVLSGNFPENTDTLIVWGNTNGQRGDTNDTDWHYGRMEHLACYDCYKEGDILIMLLQRPSKVLEKRNWQAPSEYFTTFGHCTSSVLWLRNNYVIGFVRSTYDYRNSEHVDRMSWFNFQRELNSVLQTTN